MAQPTGYTPTTDFSDEEANQVAGRSTVRTAQLDAEFANIETTLDQTLVNLALIQRDDGQLKNQSVGNDQLKSGVVIGVDFRGNWVTATAYAVNDAVQSGDAYYRCLIAHTAGVFATDLAAAKWVVTIDLSTSVSAAAASAAAAAGSAASAAGSASTASGAASAAAGSASSASTSAANSGNSATASQNSAIAAAASAASINLPAIVATDVRKRLFVNAAGNGYDLLRSMPNVGVASNLTLTGAYDGSVLVVDSTAADRFITLPPVAANGTLLAFKKAENANLVHINRNSTELIDERVEIILYRKHSSVVLFSDGSSWKILFWNDLRGALVSTGAVQTIAPGVTSPINYELESYDTENIHDTVTNNSRLTVPVGVYHIKGLTANVFLLANTSAGPRSVIIYKNGSVFLGGGYFRIDATGANQNLYNISSPPLEVVPGDYFQVAVENGSGATLTLAVNANYNWFAMRL